METITEVDRWLGQADPRNDEEVYSLYRAVSGKENFGQFKCAAREGKLFISAAHAQDTLELGSKNAVIDFLSFFEDRFRIEDDIEIWYLNRQKAAAKKNQ